MEKTLAKQVDPQGVGLAAPQVGNLRTIFIIKPSPEAKTDIFVNPKILETKQITHPQGVTSEPAHPEGVKKPKKKQKLEGCLSIPKIWGSVQRAHKVYLEYHDVSGKMHKKWFSGFKAVIIQHEVDHLQGILYTQRVLEQKNTLYEEKEGKLKKLEY